jgi:outer membrane autotransporter protein
MPDATSTLSPLTLALKTALFAPLLLVAVPAEAIVRDGVVETVSGGSWTNEVLQNQADVTYNNSRIDRVQASSGSTLTLNNANLESSGFNFAVQLTDSDLFVNGGNITSTGSVSAINVNRVYGTTAGSRAFIDGATVSGGASAINITTYSELDLRNSILTARSATGSAIEMFSATATISNSTLTGQASGILVSNERLLGDTLLTLTDSRVIGVNGAALLLEGFLDPLNANVTINGATELQGLDGTMIQLRDNATGTINVNGADLAGNILADGTSTLNLNLNGTQMTGNVVVDAGGTGNVTLDNHSVLTGRLDNVTQLNIDNQAQWVMVENSEIANLAMNGGSVKFGGAADFYTLDVANLSGSGVFAMDVDFATGEHDQLNVANASGSHEVLIASTGSDPLQDTSLHLVHTDAGDATFSLVGGSVDLGTWSYGLTGDGRDWYLDATHKTISPATASVLALFNTAPTVWYGELSSLRSRMGELRHNGGQSGAWSRVYGAKYNVSGDNGLSYSQQQNGFSLGADAPLPIGDGQWLVGVLAGHSDSDLSLARGSSGTVKSYYAGAYTTWLDAQSGYYFDGVLKFNRFDNDSKVNLSDGTRTKGSYANNAVGASAEFGRHIKLDDGYFVEPSAQLATVFIQGSNYSLDNGLDASGERTRSMLGKLGATAGKRFDLGEGRYAQPYVRAAYVHEFAKGNKVSVNDNSFNNDLSGSRGELGAGVSVAIADKWDVHADFQYTDGEKLSQPWGGNVGIRYSW